MNVVIRAAATVALASAALAAAAQPAGPAGKGQLRIGIMPDVDSLPLMVAEAEGAFAAEGVDVALVPFKSALERDAAFQAGAVDGVVADLLAAALQAQAGFDVRVASLTDGRYGLVAAPGSGLSSAADLANLPIGISANTIIQYATESLLGRAGLGAGSIAVTAVPKIQVRMELLLSGQLKAACLPEPFLTVARAKGATLVAASDDAGLRAGILLFSGKAMDSRLAEVSAFYRAYWKAASAVNASPDSYRGFLVEKAGFPEEARAAFRFVRYVKPRLPTEADVGAVLDWMGAKGLLASRPSPAALLDGRALPR